MRLAELIGEENLRVYGLTDIIVKGITADSREVKDSYIFFAYKGSKLDGRDFIPEAIKKGAKVIVTDSLLQIPYVTCIVSPEPKKVLSFFTKRFYNNIDEKMNLVGITGTQGKTTVAYLTRHILLTAGFDSGLISTIKYYNGYDWEIAKNTTPEIYKIFSLLSRLYERGIKYCVMEVSSHALAQERVSGLAFKVAGFTNLSAEHLDFHKTILDYKEAKMKLFRGLGKDSFAVYNADDPVGREIPTICGAKKISYGIKGVADISGSIKEMSFAGMRFTIKTEGRERVGRSFLFGEFALYNILCAYGIALALGIKEDSIMRGIETFRGVKGRMERVENDRGIEIFIDYAHTPKALESVLATLKPLSKRIILVCGAGGDRDKEKRPLIGKIATEKASYVIITSDNPRSEDPEEIISEIIKGVKRDNYEKITDRRKAIKRALLLARRGDTVLITGKGHEEYQIVGDREIKFSDREEVELSLKRR